jgi:mono/diheme cytochrome c family protein
MATNSLQERRKVFKQYKEDVKDRGKPFYPYAMLHDSIMSLVVVGVIVALAVIWKFTTPGNHTGFNAHGGTDLPGQSGWLGKLIDDPADPGTISFVPRPDWYFYFLFYLLRIFKWPESVFLGTVGVPTIALVLLIGLPFLDRRRVRRPSQRPVAMVAAVLTIVSMGVLTWKGATANEALASEVKQSIPKWIKDEKLPPEAKAGVTLFASAGCTACHTYDGVGGSLLGAPDLTAIGSRISSKSFQVAHLKCPSCVTPGSPMPSFASLGDARLQQLATFLVDSKGKQ